MEKATELRNILKVTKPEPLKGDDFEKFFVETDEARGKNVALMLGDFFSVNIDEPRKVLFMGHRGSGKSTELYRFGQYVKEEFRVVNFSVKDEADPSDLEYADLIFIVASKLFEQAKADGIEVNEHVLTNLDHYWNDETLIERLKIAKADVEAQAQVKGGFWSLLNMHVKGVFNIGGESKTIVREFVKPRLTLLMTAVNDLIADIARKYRAKGKTPVLIVEDLDKLDLAIAEEIFLKRKNILAAFRMHMIYTFPIFLHYSGKFDEIQSAFDHYQLLSMIKVKEKTGIVCQKGLDAVRRIMGERADLGLFAPEALDLAIRKSGGSLRHMFQIVQNAVLDVLMRNRDARQVDVLAVENAYKTLKNYFERTIGAEHLEILKTVAASPDKKPTADGKLNEMLDCMAVIEYNGDRWCDLHPAAMDILEEKKVVERAVKEC